MLKRSARSGRKLTFGAAMVALIVGWAASSAAGWHRDSLHLAQLNGRSQATIYFVDWTGSSWPVGASAAEWDRSSRIGVYRATGGCPTSGDYCVPVNEVNTSNYFGMTYSQANSSGQHYSRSGFYINLSNQTPLHGRRSVACHEEGHALGLNHQFTTDTCMWNNDKTTFPNLPNGHDFAELGSIYNHSG